VAALACAVVNAMMSAVDSKATCEVVKLVMLDVMVIQTP
jgi:hypothetical protein